MSHLASLYAKELRKMPRGGKPLRVGHKALLMVLADYHNPRTNTAWPAVKTLCADACIPERTLYRYLADLTAGGVLEVVPRYGANGAQIGNEYRFLDLEGHGLVEPRQQRGGRPPVAKMATTPRLPNPAPADAELAGGDAKTDMPQPLKEPASEPAIEPVDPDAAECADCERAVNRYGQGHQAGCRREHARPQDRWFVARTASAGADVGHSPVGESPGTARPGARAVA